MKTMILAAAAVVALGMGTAFAEGEGGPTAGGLNRRRRTATRRSRRPNGLRWRRLPGKHGCNDSGARASALWPGLTQNGNAVAQRNANPQG